MPHQIAELDDELSMILSETVGEPTNIESSLRDQIATIRRLLDAGAGASELEAFPWADEVPRPPDVGALVDTIYERLGTRPDTPCPRLLHKLLMDLVCSPCILWRYHRHYLGGGVLLSPLPYFSLRFFVFGNSWKYGRPLQYGDASFEDRWMGWKVFRLMILNAHANEGDDHGDLVRFLIFPCDITELVDKRDLKWFCSNNTNGKRVYFLF